MTLNVDRVSRAERDARRREPDAGAYGGEEMIRRGNHTNGGLDHVDLRLIDTFPASDAVARY